MRKTSLVAQMVKVSACNVGDPSSTPGSGRSPGEGNGNPFQYSCLENPMDGGAWWATVHGVSKSRTRLSDFTFTTSLTFLHNTALKLFCLLSTSLAHIQNTISMRAGTCLSHSLLYSQLLEWNMCLLVEKRGRNSGGKKKPHTAKEKSEF